MNHLIYTLWSHPHSTHITHEDDENWYCGHGTFSKDTLVKVDCPEGSRVYSVQIEGYREAVGAQIYINSKKVTDVDLYPNHFVTSHSAAMMELKKVDTSETGKLEHMRAGRAVMLFRAMEKIKCLETRLSLEIIANATGGLLGYDEGKKICNTIDSEKEEEPK